MLRHFAFVLLLTPAAALAQAEEPLVLSVNPSGFEAPSPAERLEAMVRRREAAERRFRSICRGCSGSDPWGGASFEPQRALQGQDPAGP